MPAKKSPWFNARTEPPVNGGPWALYERMCPNGNMSSKIELVGKRNLTTAACSKCQLRGLLRESDDA